MTDIHWGQSRVRSAEGEADLSIVEMEGETWYRIGGFDRMPPFLMTVVSAYDHWMYVSSNGGLTCGRRDPDGALFPYETDDRIHDAHATTGPFTAFLIEKQGETFLWKPFGEALEVYDVERNLYKSEIGNQLRFEEINRDLGLVFSYTWSSSNRFGFVRTSTLRNIGAETLRIQCLDGLRNLLPQGVTRYQQSLQSTLLDAYKRAEKPEGLAAGIFSLSSQLTDRAEPSEALRATLVWSLGLENTEVLLSEDQVTRFCTGQQIDGEVFKRGKRGAFLVHSSLEAEPGDSHAWCTIADVNLGPVEIGDLFTATGFKADWESVSREVSRGSQRLRRLVADADGFQDSSDDLVNGRHFSNVLFNIMRGGVFDDSYRFPRDDFLESVERRNAPLADVFAPLLEDEPGLERNVVLEVARQAGDSHLERLSLEYLPLKFSRRHGDPSRPWNHFCIDIRGEDGGDRLSYEGNWRDIFQNWEALAISYPEYIESFIAKFVNASTADGYNPYRIFKHGIDWEVLDPDEPWSNIGYWGDHQVNYLVPLLELSRRYHPGSIEKYLDRKIFVYADVPYRIRPYDALVSNPADTIAFDAAHDGFIASRVADLGTDGKLLLGVDSQIVQVSLLEKLLLAVLARLGNFVPGGGIWMNTQRPEWNDANNALVGFGLSMVTLCYLRRFVALLLDMIAANAESAYAVSMEVGDYFSDQSTKFDQYIDALLGGVDNKQRKQVLDALGQSAERYRTRVYAGFSGQETQLTAAEILNFLKSVLKVLDATIRQNQRPDGLYHAYNLVHFDADGYRLERLSEMLEGQVAVLNSGCLDAAESLALLDALRKSEMYRPDQRSYTLYPDRVLPGFLEKNIIPASLVEDSAWLQEELESNTCRYVERDASGQVHFRGRFRNVYVLREALESDSHVSSENADHLCEIYERVFNHRAFTGRSGSMCKYEGLGCIYWHMVSKLLLAISEVIARARHEAPDLLDGLMRQFDETRDGLGLHKSPEEYGAFPTDPYSHTPGFVGVQQPGMTGQVKEDIIIRFRELGVAVRDGRVSFDPFILRRSEFSEGENHTLEFSLCAVPVIYRLSDDEHAIRVTPSEGGEKVFRGRQLDRDWSRSLFGRDGTITKIEVEIPRASLRP